MAPRKKKTEKEIVKEIAELTAEITLQDTQIKPVKVTAGSHLTVYTYNNGKTKLEWDDAALLRDVQQAILKFESNIPVAAPKKVKKAK